MINPIQMMQQFNQFRQSFRGDPREEVMKLVQSGQMSQKQLNDIQNQATQFQAFMNSFKR